MKIYWNNICLVTQMEEKYVEQIKREASLDIDVEYFGLGRKMSMLEKTRQMKKDQINDADVIVSTDTEVFHNMEYREVYKEYEECVSYFPLKQTPATQDLIHPKGLFVPFITIPLVMVYNKSFLQEVEPPKSFQDLLDPKYKGLYTFGGNRNSAGKSLIKSIWCAYGEEAAEQFANNAHIQSMPAAAFNKVLKGELPIAIVPTIFSKRAGIKNMEMIWPEDGAVPIPSYIAMKKGISEEKKEWIVNHLLGEEFQQNLVEKACILANHKDVESTEGTSTKNEKLLIPSWEFLERVNHEKVQELLINK